MSGFQSFIEIQLQERLQMLGFVILKNPELPGIRRRFPRHEMDSDIIKERIVAAAFYRIGDPACAGIPERETRSGPQYIGSVTDVRVVESDLPNKRAQRLTDRSDILQAPAHSSCSMLYRAATSGLTAQVRSAAPTFSPPALAEWADTSSNTIPAAPHSIPPDS